METQQLQTGVRVPFCFETFRPHHHPELSGAGWGSSSVQSKVEVSL